MQEETVKYFGMVSEIEGLTVNNFPNKFPMFFLGTQDEIDEYNRLMLKAISLGFDPKIRKLCFTLQCREGYNHEDMFNLIKDLPEIDEERYTLLKNIVHWDPVQASTKVLKNYITLADATREAAEESDFKEILDEAMAQYHKEADIKVYKKEETA